MKPSTLQIRRYKKADEEAILRLNMKAMLPLGMNLKMEWYEDLKDIESVYIRPGGEFLVGTIDGQIIAMGALKKISAELAHVRRMRVDPEFQTRGFGQAILGSLENRARELGFKILELDTGVVQEAAQKFYIKNGYEEFQRATIGEIPCIYYRKVI